MCPEYHRGQNYYQKPLYKEKVLAQYTKVQDNHFTKHIPWLIFLQKGTHHWQHHCLVEVFLLNYYKRKCPKELLCNDFGQDGTRPEGVSPSTVGGVVPRGVSGDLRASGMSKNCPKSVRIDSARCPGEGVGGRGLATDRGQNKAKLSSRRVFPSDMEGIRKRGTKWFESFG